MKRITTFAVAVLAALLMTALLGSASASASGTVLCDGEMKDQTFCKEGSILPAGTTLKSYVSTVGAEGPVPYKFQLTNFLTQFNCKYMQLNAITTAELGKPLPATSDNYLNVSYCTNNGGACSSATIGNPPVTIEDSTPVLAGTVKFGTASEPLTISFKCVGGGLTSECTYAATSSPVTMTIDENGNASIKEVSMTRTGTYKNCDATAKLTMEGLSEYEKGWIASSPGTVLCDGEMKDQTFCKEGSILPAGTTLKSYVSTVGAEGPVPYKFQLTNFLTQFNCKYMQLNAITTAEWGKPLPATSDNYLNVSYCTNLGGACSSATIGNPPVTIEDSTPVLAGTVKFGTASEPLTISFKCVGGGLTSECTYAATSSPVTMTIDENGNASIKEVSMTRTGTYKNCDATAKLTMEGLSEYEKGWIASF